MRRCSAPDSGCGTRRNWRRSAPRTSRRAGRALAAILPSVAHNSVPSRRGCGGAPPRTAGASCSATCAPSAISTASAAPRRGQPRRGARAYRPRCANSSPCRPGCRRALDTAAVKAWPARCAVSDRSAPARRSAARPREAAKATTRSIDWPGLIPSTIDAVAGDAGIVREGQHRHARRARDRRDGAHVLGQQRPEEQAIAVLQRLVRRRRRAARGVVAGDPDPLAAGVEQSEVGRVEQRLAERRIRSGQRHQHRDPVARLVGGQPADRPRGLGFGRFRRRRRRDRRVRGTQPAITIAINARRAAAQAPSRSASEQLAGEGKAMS